MIHVAHIERGFIHLRVRSAYSLLLALDEDICGAGAYTHTRQREMALNSCAQ